MAPDVEPLASRSTAAQDAYAALRAAIISGRIKPDERLLENQLADRLGVSRTPVREALLMLETEGLVQSVPNRGTVVRRFSPSEIRDTYNVRLILESEAAALAARRITPPALDELEIVHREMTALATAGTAPTRELTSKLAELNAQFHTVIVRAAGNPVLFRLANSLIQTPLYARAYYSLDQGLRDASLAAHERMISLLGTRDGGACAEHWRAHIRHGRDHLAQSVGAGRDEHQSASDELA